MPLSWVLSFLVGTKQRFRREAWKITPSKWITWKNDGVMVTMDGGNTFVPYTFTDEDIAANDWKGART